MLLREVDLPERTAHGHVLVRFQPLALALILAATAIPFEFRDPAWKWVGWFSGWDDLVLNVLLYVPLGLACGRSLKRTLLFAAALSLPVEVFQIWCVGRFPSFGDLLTNILGAAAGWSQRGTLARLAPLLKLRRLAVAALGAGLICVAILVPKPARSDFSTWDPSFPLFYGDEPSGGRKWSGEVLESAILPADLAAKRVAELARAGPGSLQRAGLVEQPFEIRRAMQSGRLSVLLWIRTESVRQSGPARIVTSSPDIARRNFTVGQEGRRIVFRLRTPSTGVNGAQPETETGPVLEAHRDTFVAATYDGRHARIYIDGAPAGKNDLGAVTLFEPAINLVVALLAGAGLCGGTTLLAGGRRLAPLIIFLAGAVVIVGTHDALARVVMVYTAGALAGVAAALESRA